MNTQQLSPKRFSLHSVLQIITLTLGFLVMLSSASFGQGTDEESIKQIAQTSFNELLNWKADKWKESWTQDDKARLAVSGSSFHAEALGWDSIVKLVATFPQPEHPDQTRTSASNFIIRTNGNMATADFVTTVVSPSTDSAGARWHSFSSLVKEGSDWKVTSQVLTLVSSYDAKNPRAIEDNINNAGYQLMNANRLNDAIELFKLNVKFFPKAWNPYDSLGEAYAKAGKKDLAIKNYEMSIKLNPNNDNGKKMLEKIKQNKPL
jgi:tetratricopeptide (TPR) repeat protein